MKEKFACSMSKYGHSVTSTAGLGITSGKPLILIFATGDKNLVEQQSGRQMNDLEHCSKQLLDLQTAVIQLDLDDGVKVNYLKLYEALATIPGIATKKED